MFKTSLLTYLVGRYIPYRVMFLLVQLLLQYVSRNNLADIYLFKVNNRNTRKRCEIGSKLTIKTPLMFILFTLNKYMSDDNGHYHNSPEIIFLVHNQNFPKN